MMLYKIIWLCFFIDVVNAFGRTQSVAVEGVLMCDDQQARDVLVKLYEEDTLLFRFQNDLNINRPYGTQCSTCRDRNENVSFTILRCRAEEHSITPDELMDSSKTDNHGKFRLSGFAEEITEIDPKINIYHDCDDGIKPCQRKLTIYIPSQYITNTKQPTKTFNLGILQLAAEYPDEERDCFHA